MEEKKVTKISLSNFFLILAIIAIIVMGIYIYKLNNDKSAEIQKSTELQAQVNSLEGTVSDLQRKINTISNTINNSIKEDNSTTSNVSDKNYIDNNILFTEKQLKDTFQNYLDLIGAKEGSPSNFLKELKLISEDSSKEARKQGYMKTDVKYSKFKETLLNYVTERCYKDDINFNNSFIEEDGYLCYFNGGATGMVYKVEKVTKVSDKVYKVKGIFLQEEAGEEVNFEFGIENNNGKCIIDYCNQY